MSNITNITTNPFLSLPAEMIVKVLEEHAASLSSEESSHLLGLRTVCRAWSGAVNTAYRMRCREILKNPPSGPIPLKDVLTSFPEEGPDVVQKINQKIIALARDNGVILPSHTVCLNRVQLEEIQAKAQEQDNALQLVWEMTLRWSVFWVLAEDPLEIILPHVDAPAAEIRAFLRNSAHAELLTKILTLELSFSPNLTVLPSEIALLKGLKSLRLSNTLLKETPDVSQFPLLTILDLSDTLIRKVPDVSKNSRLVVLDLSNTLIQEAPNVRENLALRTLCLSKTPIKEASDLTHNAALKWLYLADTQIQEPPDVKRNLALKTLDLSNTPLQKAPKLRYNTALEILKLSYTLIKKVPKLRDNTALQALHLAGIQTIREAPDISDKPLLIELSLAWTPLMFINDLVLTKFAEKGYVTRFLEQREYPCVSPLAHLYQHIICLRDEAQVVEAFHALPQEDKNLIYEMVWEESGKPQTEDAQWGEHHVFDEMRFFHYAVQRTIFAKLDRLSEEQKNRVYGQIYELAQKPVTTDAQWGEDHARENLPRLADALAAIKGVCFL